MSDDARESVGSPDVIATNRWYGITALALLPVAVGVLTRYPPLVLAGAVGVAYAAYARGSDTPAAELSIARELSDPAPAPGDDVTVTLRLTNRGDGVIPDLRVVDSVPPALATDDPARLGTALRPGRSATLRYTVTAVRGEHAWGPAQVLIRNASGTFERELALHDETTLRCAPELSGTTALPLRGLTSGYAGRVATDIGGAGLEFHSTREYRRGDPASRIDWSRFARTGELSTLQFREERAATVVVVVDARDSAYLAPAPTEPNAVERSVEAAGHIFSALLDAGDQVGLAAFAPEPCWLAPSTGPDHRARARELLASHSALSPTPATDDGGYLSPWRRRFRRRLPADAQVVLLSPVTDDYVVSLARRLDAHGHPVTIVSPDPTADDTPGHRLARIERATRLTRLREAEIRVVDWGSNPLEAELERAQARWIR